ncbi:MAG: hypothetical protein Q8Q08_08850 [Candidatus Omnitrophota bacterium]|nr:hypothetical protein [Candidatus Omnitrophota bacterium]
MRTLQEKKRDTAPSLWYYVVLSALCLINLAIFAGVASTPIHWQQGEFGYYNLFWSTRWEGRETLLLESGLRPTDFLKIFQSQEVDTWFRARHFSYLTEMLAFKAKQSFEIVSFHSISIFTLHLTNVTLCFLITRILTKSTAAAMLTALLCLNSGIAIATVLFPFRNAKLLVTALTLGTWLFILSTDGRFLKSSGKRIAGFIVLTMLSCFTDELSVFLVPVSFLLIFWKSPNRKEDFPKLLMLALGILFLHRTLYTLIILFEARFQNLIIPDLNGIYLQQLAQSYSSIAVAAEITQIFFMEFLRKNFGYWDSTWGGALSLGAFAGLVFFTLLHAHEKRHRPILTALAIVILGQCLFSIDIFTTNIPFKNFPSIFYANYYYTYPASIMACLWLGLGLSRTILTRKPLVLASMLLITVINLSNFRHKDQLVETPLKIHGYHQTHRPIIPHILALEKKLPGLLKSGPVYLSFPSGSRPVFQRKLGAKDLWSIDPVAHHQELLPSFASYSTLIPVAFLRRIERGDLVMSLQNVSATTAPGSTPEPFRARWFCDVPRGVCLDLTGIKNSQPEEHRSLKIIKKDTLHRTIAAPKPKPYDRCVFFVKGAASIDVHGLSQEPIHLRQRYGNSFQMFEVPPADHDGGPVHVELTVVPVGPGDHQVEFLGPFFLN